MPGLLTVPGTDVLYRKWGVDGPRAIVLLVYGMGAHNGRWEFLADFLLKNKYSSYAVELKGYGETPDQVRGHVDSFDLYYRDIRELLQLIKIENPGKKVFILGESMGGLISFIFSALHPDELTGTVLISPAFKNGMHFSTGDYINIFSSLLFNPRKQVSMPFTSAMCTRDYEYQRAMDADPRESRFASSKMLWNNLTAQMKAWKLKDKLKAPVLFLVAGVDMLVDSRETRKLFDSLKLKDKNKIEYPGMYHALSIEKGREQVFGDILFWLNQRS
ncbi:MAG TPA: lysophospholipase [Candidatus Omnitrophota bacterium]|nr:lysophospholipase [Candidatus Omnitrophota bacterium]